MRIGTGSSVVLGACIIAVGGTGIASAASNGHDFLLGHSNVAPKTTTLQSLGGSPLTLKAPSGKAPLSVNSSVQVPNLNASQLDGLTAQEIEAASVPPTDTSPDATITQVIGRMTNFSGIVLCPAGTHPLGGGVLPDPTGATDLPFVAASMAHITGGVLDGWEGVAGDLNHTYKGAGFVFVSCTSSPVTQLSSNAEINDFKAVARRAAHQ